MVSSPQDSGEGPLEMKKTGTSCWRGEGTGRIRTAASIMPDSQIKEIEEAIESSVESLPELIPEKTMAFRSWRDNGSCNFATASSYRKKIRDEVQWGRTISFVGRLGASSMSEDALFCRLEKQVSTELLCATQSCGICTAKLVDVAEEIY